MNEELLFAIRRANASLRRKQSGDESGISRKGYGHLLEVLKDGGLSQQQIAEKMCIRPQTVSEMISGLEKDGWIQKLPCPDDKRSSLIYITEEGKAARERIRKHRRAKADAYFGVLSEEEKMSLIEMLNKLNDNLKGGNACQ